MVVSPPLHRATPGFADVVASFPASLGDPARHSAARGRTMPEGTTALHLLLIEDDADVAAMYALALMAAGHDVRVAFDGRSGLRAARGRPPPGLLLLDARLPQLEGYALLERLREDPVTATLPVVILSNFRTPEMAQRGVELGAMAH